MAIFFLYNYKKSHFRMLKNYITNQPKEMYSSNNKPIQMLYIFNWLYHQFWQESDSSIFSLINLKE